MVLQRFWGKLACMKLEELLKQIHLFSEASAQDLTAVAAIGEPRMHLAGEYIYHTGEIPDSLFIIEAGTIDVILKDKDIPIASVGAGQALGEMAFFEREGRLASAVTHETTHLMRLPFVRLDQILAQRPSLALSFYRHACVFFARQLRAVAPDLDKRYF